MQRNEQNPALNPAPIFDVSDSLLPARNKHRPLPRKDWSNAAMSRGSADMMAQDWYAPAPFPIVNVCLDRADELNSQLRPVCPRHPPPALAADIAGHIEERELNTCDL
jgi:hypothetical protein